MANRVRYSRATDMSAFAISGGKGSEIGASPASGGTNLSCELGEDAVGRGRAEGGEAGVGGGGGAGGSAGPGEASRGSSDCVEDMS